MLKKILLNLILLSTYSFSEINIYNTQVNIQVNYININNINIYKKRNRFHTLFSDNKTYHLGDENFKSRKWAPLHGQCYFIRFRDNQYSGTYALSLKRFGTESAAVFINDYPIGYLPDQAYHGRKRPNYWTAQEYIKIPGNRIRTGLNTLAICASPVRNPEFLGDLDDFQIKNIRLYKLDD